MVGSHSVLYRGGKYNSVRDNLPASPIGVLEGEVGKSTLLADCLKPNLGGGEGRLAMVDPDWLF